MATFNSDQIARYLKRIKLDPAIHLKDASKLEPEEGLEYLKVLQKHHLVEIPFENLTLHYSNKTISLHPDDLFEKAIETPGRGGYCMENNFLFGMLLRSLGFQVYSAGKFDLSLVVFAKLMPSRSTGRR